MQVDTVVDFDFEVDDFEVDFEVDLGGDKKKRVTVSVRVKRDGGGGRRSGGWCTREPLGGGSAAGGSAMNSATVRERRLAGHFHRRQRRRPKWQLMKATISGLAARDLRDRSSFNKETGRCVSCNSFAYCGGGH